MQPGFSNGQRYWMSSDGAAIWYAKDDEAESAFGMEISEDKWYIGPSKNLGTTSAPLYVAIKDPSKECPHDNLQSNWMFYTGNESIDVDNYVSFQCVPPS